MRGAGHPGSESPDPPFLKRGLTLKTIFLLFEVAVVPKVSQNNSDVMQRLIKEKEGVLQFHSLESPATVS